jgi:hypothetical protein
VVQQHEQFELAVRSCRSTAASQGQCGDFTVLFCVLQADALSCRLMLCAAMLRRSMSAEISSCVMLCCAVLQADAVPGIILMLWTLTVVMKLVSYAHCHADLRTAHRRSDLRPGERGAPGEM